MTFTEILDCISTSDLNNKALCQELVLLAMDIKDAKGASKELLRLKEAESVLRQIAQMKRKTREQRLANSCITFLDQLGNL
jgi:hypothetical protein